MDPPPDGTQDLPAADHIAADPLAPGQMIGRFVIRERLGEGGMGIVLAGEDPDLGRRVAIKLVRSEVDLPAYRARLLREAQAMARIEHPGVARVYEVGEHAGRLFVAMELVPGATLMTWVRVQRRPWREVVAVFRQIGAGLATVHRAGLVHRDFKPDNVLVDRDGKARVVDFGLARVTSPSAPVSPELAASLTRTGMVVGTPGYMAPEQQLGDEIDARADQYSYCVALREALLSGAGGEWSRIPRRLRAVVARGLAFEPDERYPSMDALIAALGRATGRGRVVIAGATVATVCATAIAATVTWPEHDESAPPEIVVATASGVADAMPAPDAGVLAVAADAAPAPAPDRPERPDRADRPIASAPPRRTSPVRPPDRAGSGSAEAAPAPARSEMDPQHLAAVRAAIAELGYSGLTFEGNDLDGDIRDLRGKLAASNDDLERGALLFAIGAAERRRGDCGAAREAWREARTHLHAVANDLPIRSAEHERQRTRSFVFHGRTRIGDGLCELAAGRARAAEKLLADGIRNLFGVADAERARGWFAIGIARWETGDPGGVDDIRRAGRAGDEPLRARIIDYAARVGLRL
jgi:predicted Ser/Thr protein kinase